jgi:hypothetical protein
MNVTGRCVGVGGRCMAINREGKCQPGSIHCRCWAPISSRADFHQSHCPSAQCFIVPAEPVALGYVHVRMLHLNFHYPVEEIMFWSEIHILVEPQPRWYIWHKSITFIPFSLKPDINLESLSSVSMLDQHVPDYRVSTVAPSTRGYPTHLAGALILEKWGSLIECPAESKYQGWAYDVSKKLKFISFVLSWCSLNQSSAIVSVGPR